MKIYKLACGHNNGGILNIYPFKTWLCFECGNKSDYIIKVKGGLKHESTN